MPRYPRVILSCTQLRMAFRVDTAALPDGTVAGQLFHMIFDKPGDVRAADLFFAF